MSDISLYVMAEKARPAAIVIACPSYASNENNKKGCLIRDPSLNRNT